MSASRSANSCGSVGPDIRQFRGHWQEQSAGQQAGAGGGGAAGRQLTGSTQLEGSFLSIHAGTLFQNTSLPSRNDSRLSRPRLTMKPFSLKKSASSGEMPGSVAPGSAPS